MLDVDGILTTLVIVVLYNKEVHDSKTIQSLNKLSNRNFDLVVVNNGPNRIDMDLNYIDSFQEYLWNKPLSNIYNDIINNNQSYSRFVILDDDSIVPNNFLDELNANYVEDIDLQVPLIVNSLDNRIYYPKLNHKTINESQLGENISEYSEFHSIGSGLVVYHNLLKKFDNYGFKLFDENLVFYGVDITLFKRIINLKSKYKLSFKIFCISRFNHSLSEKEPKFSKWKKDEMLVAQTLLIKYYSRNNFKLFLSLFKILIKQTLTFNISNIYLVIKTFIIGKHSRSLLKDELSE
ncbi:hypothetical protein ABLT60_09975 [Acinetobacter ursingii]|uniref:glycosyltransferase family 2 protein n=1 Tax=Acinetobacter ursingii TaxID=108980 RepID=UPI0032B3CDFD